MTGGRWALGMALMLFAGAAAAQSAGPSRGPETRRGAGAPAETLRILPGAGAPTPAQTPQAPGGAGVTETPTPGAPAPPGTGGPHELLVRGNAYYEQGRYEEAARAYQTALTYGVQNEVLHYNLGNALYRLGRLGPAILHYERALLLKPGDRDIRANLDYARAHAADDHPPPDEGPIAIVRGWLQRLDVNASALAALAMYLAGTGLLGLALLRRRRRNPLLWMLGVVALLLAIPPALVVATQGAARELDDRAVVLAERVECRSGPGESNPVLFAIHEGATVEIVDAREGWSRISLPDGLNGWLPSASVERVVPRPGT